VFARLTLVAGPEQFLAEREVARLTATARQARPDAAVVTTAGSELTASGIDQMSGTDLFSTATIARITNVDKAPKAMESPLLTLARSVPDDVALIISHTSANQGKALLDKLKPLAARIVDCPMLKAWNLAKFVIHEARDAGTTIDAEAAQALVDSVGQDTRSLAAAVTQLVSDAEGGRITTSVVSRYFAGRATISAYAVSDDAVAGRVSDAIMKLRWALSTGVAHVMVTAALATSFRQIGNYLAAARDHSPTAAEVGAPAWKLKDVAAAARPWTEQAVAAAIRAVSQADGQIKGAGQDPDFALEHLLIRLAALRRAGRRA
jgi:DNA polymerase-3 subunit delta